MGLFPIMDLPSSPARSDVHCFDLIFAENNGYDYLIILVLGCRSFKADLSTSTVHLFHWWLVVILCGPYMMYMIDGKEVQSAHVMSDSILTIQNFLWPYSGAFANFCNDEHPGLNN